jgi:hypothetical protein
LDEKKMKKLGIDSKTALASLDSQDHRYQVDSDLIEEEVDTLEIFNELLPRNAFTLTLKDIKVYQLFISICSGTYYSKIMYRMINLTLTLTLTLTLSLYLILYC